MCIVRVISLYVKLIRTLAYSQEKYEVYINARNSRVLYSVSLSPPFFSLSLQLSLLRLSLQAPFLLRNSLQAPTLGRKIQFALIRLVLETTPLRTNWWR